MTWASEEPEYERLKRLLAWRDGLDTPPDVTSEPTQGLVATDHAKELRVIRKAARRSAEYRSLPPRRKEAASS